MVEGDVAINNVIDATYIEQTINRQVIIYQQPQMLAHVICNVVVPHTAPTQNGDSW